MCVRGAKHQEKVTDELLYGAQGKSIFIYGASLGGWAGDEST